jgi:hypothetical protein
MRFNGGWAMPTPFATNFPECQGCFGIRTLYVELAEFIHKNDYRFIK